MSDPFVGQIMLFAGNFAPTGWFLCAGQTLAIQQYAALFAIIGTTYGGNGVTTFNLPDLRSRVPVGANLGGNPPGLTPYALGEPAGVENVTLLQTQIPAHTHLVSASSNSGDQVSPANNYIATGVDSQGGSVTAFTANAPNVHLNTNALTLVGGSQPHTNIQPVLGCNYIIAYIGVFPSRG